MLASGSQAKEAKLIDFQTGKVVYAGVTPDKSIFSSLMKMTHFILGETHSVCFLWTKYKRANSTTIVRDVLEC